MTRIEELKARMRQQFITGATGQDVFSDLVSAYESEIARKVAALNAIWDFVRESNAIPATHARIIEAECKRVLTPARETGETK